MKFDCGLDRYEKLKQYQAEQQHIREYNFQWHRVFAWWPVRVASRDCRWFEYVERRDKSLERSKFSGRLIVKDCHLEYEWEYRAITP